MSTSQKLPPKPLVQSLQTFRSWLLFLHNRLFPQQVIVYELFQNYYLLSSLAVVSELDIAGLLQKGKQPVELLAKTREVDVESLYRILRALASIGIFKEKPIRHFSLTARANILLDGQSASLRSMLRHHLSPLNWKMMGDLSATVRSGKDGFSRHFGKTIYDYLPDYPDQYAVFDQSMSELTAMGLPAILQSYSFKGIRNLADLGGGEGLLLATLLKKYPSMHGVLFDVPAALKKARETVQRFGLGDRMVLTEGDFQKSVPNGMDTYLLKNILHNWDDFHCIQLLSRIRDAMPYHGKVIIIDMVVPTGNRFSSAKLIDIQMLATMPGGKERTKREFNHLFQEAGLKMHRLFSTVSPIAIMELRKPAGHDA